MFIQEIRSMMQSSMKVIGITGGIGAGKSAVLSILKDIDGVYVIEADKLAHELMMPGHDVYDDILHMFGSSILNEDGTINRKCLSDQVLNNKENLERLDKIVHPAVKQYILKDIGEKSEMGNRVYVIEAALLIQDGYKEICDEIWYINVDTETRISRLISSRGYSRDKALSFISNQPDDAFFIKNSDAVIDNNGSLEGLREEIYAEINRVL